MAIYPIIHFLICRFLESSFHGQYLKMLKAIELQS